MKMALSFLISMLVIVNSSNCRAAAQQAATETDISALSAVIVDAESGRVIYGKHENKRLPMASTTKIMSALLTLESGDIDSEFVVDSEAVKTEGSSMGLREGDIVSKRDLCIGMLLPSGNDAANCAAVRVAGDMISFAELMNERAEDMGLMSTHFVTPSGLHDDEHYSTACDMARLAAYALENDTFREICSSQSIGLEYGDPPYPRRLYNTNKLLSRLEGCIGVKTGFTDEAGRCLVSAVERNGVRLVCVTLNAPDDWKDHEKLYGYAFKRVRCENADVPGYLSVSVVGGRAEGAELVCAEPPVYTKIDGAAQNITWKAVIPQIIYAPVAMGDEVGEMVVYDNGIEVDRVKLLAAQDVAMSDKKPVVPVADRIIEWIKELLF